MNRLTEDLLALGECGVGAITSFACKRFRLPTLVEESVASLAGFGCWIRP